MKQRNKILGASLLGLLLFISSVRAEDQAPGIDLQLEVVINGQPTGMIAAFRLNDKGELASTKGELDQLGIATPDGAPPETAVALSEVKGLTYKYNDVNQTVSIVLPDGSRVPKTYDAAPVPKRAATQQINGLVVNYEAFASATSSVSNWTVAPSGGSLGLDSRWGTRFGDFNQTGLIGTTADGTTSALRLNTFWTKSDPGAMRTYTAGDFVSSGPGWSRPVRMGGVQIRRNFATQPGLITSPQPGFSGSAAVPSTVDVFVNNVKAYTQQVEAGPFEIKNIPVVQGSGTAQIVVTDPAGRTTTQTADFFSSSSMLKAGLYDYSLDAGLLRRGYGTDSFDYGAAGTSGSLRYGINDTLTGELHGEMSADLVNAGVGVVTGHKWLGRLSAAVSASADRDDHGLMVFGGWDGSFGKFYAAVQIRKIIGGYEDLASYYTNGNTVNGYLPTIESEGLTLSYDLADLGMSASAGVLRAVNSAKDESLIVSASLNKTIFDNVSLYGSGFMDLKGDGAGAYFGAYIPLGGNYSASSASNLTRAGLSVGATYGKSMSDNLPGDYAWHASRTQSAAPYTTADASYATSMGTAQGTIMQSGTGLAGSASFNGAMVVADGGVYLTDRVNDAYAIVDAGAKDIPVRVENHLVGTSGSGGKLLVTGLHSYQDNKISLDLDQVPAGIAFSQTEANVVPKSGGASLVKFGPSEEGGSALVTLTDETGESLAPGTQIRVAGQPDTYSVGFDGQVYLQGLKGRNRVTAELTGKTCEAEFAFNSNREDLAMIGPLKCASAQGATANSDGGIPALIGTAG